jgi:hypothetical protein
MENEHEEWSALCSQYPPDPLKELKRKAKSARGDGVIPVVP